MSTMISKNPSPLGFLMNRTRVLAAASVLLMCAPCSAQPRREFSENNQTLTVEFPNGCPARYGFHPVKLTAVNTGNQAVVWEVQIQETRTGRHDAATTKGYREKIAVPPRRSVEREILVVMGRTNEHSWSYRQVEVTHPSGMTNSWSPSGGNNRTDRYGLNAPALVTKEAAQKIRNAPDESDEFHGRMYDPALAPGDWRAYSAYALVVLTPVDWQAMTPAARSALGDWTRLGGHLQFLGDLPADAPVPDQKGSSARGLGGVHAPPQDVETTPAPAFSNLPGAVAVRASNHPASESASMNDRSLLEPWLALSDSDLLRDRFTIWPMVVVLIAFFVMITPVNLFVLAPSQRRHRLFRTIPVISLAACAVLALAVALGDGFGGRGQRLVLIESRPGTDNRQYITQWQASRCGALIGTGFTVPDAAYICPLRDTGSALAVNFEGDKLEASGGWFTSRATQSQFLQAARPGRGRIEWSAKDASAPTAVSTFEFPLRDVYVAREDGSYWHAPVMRQGETTALHIVLGREVREKLDTAFVKMPQSGDLLELSKRHGHFIAFTDDPPAIQTLRSVRWKDVGIVTGALAIP